MSNNVYLVRFFHPDAGVRLGLHLGDSVHDVSAHYQSVGDWLRQSSGKAQAAIDELITHGQHAAQVYDAALLDNAPNFEQPHWLPPVDEQLVWAAGVTYENSRLARQEESEDGGDVYARVYNAPRPELFFKANGRDVVGPLGEVGIRADATWSVPEPELAVVMNPRREVVGFSVGNDMSSRDLEGANPLYLPQAKMYIGSCALGHGILLTRADELPQTTITLSIQRDGATAFENSVSTQQIKRRLAELVDYLWRSNHFPDGVVMLTGTGIVPPVDFTLQAGDVITISIDQISQLVNTVRVV